MTPSALQACRDVNQSSVLIVQRLLPPYRLAFFQHLAATAPFGVTFSYGQGQPDCALESIVAPEGLNVTQLRNLSIGKRETLVYQMGLPSLIRSKRYNIIIAEFNPRIISNIAAFFQAKRQKLKFIWWGHGIRPRSSDTAIRIYRWLAQHADAIILYTQAAADQLTAHGVPKNKIFVAWNSIDIDEIDSLVQHLPMTRRNRVLFIGRLIPEKKPGLLIEAFANASSRLSSDIVLTLVGDGPERTNLERLVRQFNIDDRVEFVGSTYNQDQLAPYFNTSWISVSPGYIGLSAIHSMAFGVPMLVADKEPHSPEIAVVEDGKNAVFFRANDTKDMAQHLIRLSKQPDQLEQMSVASRKAVRSTFGVKAMVDAFLQAIRYAHSIS
ncbi:MAG TPA: glycosyltransferase family 4 protein [Chthonomonadaceae bacterium]|nr:glycosyltransferase family 4 protein [Chthonomonadaceae bacterium]